MLFSIGETLKDGKYEIEKLLGAGGFGVTYLARETTTGTKVAIKTLNRDRTRKNFETLRDKFINEAVALAQCQHPHVVRVYPQGFFVDELWCIVMEYVDGISLEDYIEDNGALSEGEAIALIEKLASALSAVHQQGFLHRDIKPSNILLRHSDLNSPVLIDFGLARSFGSDKLHNFSTTDGTRGYAPIEQFERQRQNDNGEWTDVYALAATLYYLVAEESPTASQIRLYAPEAFNSPRHYNPAIGDRLDRFIMAGMTVEPRERPQSVDEWLQLLHSAPEPPPAPNNNASSPEPVAARPPLSRRRLLTFAGFAAGGLGIAVVGRAIVVFSGRWAPKLDPSQLGEIAYEFESVSIDAEGNISSRYEGQVEGYVEALNQRLRLEMVKVDAGTFWMGSPQGEGLDWEKPQRQVNVPSFYLSRYPISQAQWRAIAAQPKVNIDLNSDPSHFRGRDRPVESISWEEAVEFSTRLARQSGRQYRLPSEAEWEYACRGGTTAPFYVGETLTTDLANYDGSSTFAEGPRGQFRGQTTPIGSFPGNPFGLYDMHGNVWEWCADRFQNTYEGAPVDGSALESDDDTSRRDRVLRGGAWDRPPEDCRSARRLPALPNFRDRGVGFRIAFSAV